jgi:Phosphate transport (Pho88)
MQFNKMMVMVPVMLAARKLNAEDPNMVYWLRVAYACMQCVCLVVVVYTYIKASALAAGKMTQLIYVPPPAMVRR